MTYGLLAIGLILAYRSSGIINFALGNVGGVAAAIMGRMSLSLGLPWLVVFPIALASGGITAAALEVGVMRRLRKAPKVMAIVATLGAAQLLLGIAGSITQLRNTALFPPPFQLSFHVGSFLVTPYYVLLLILSPIILLLLVLFLSPPEWLPKRLRSRYGPAIRASSDNPEAARTAGIPTGAMSALAWGISGVIAAFAATLLGPARGFQTIDALGPELLVRALAPAVVAAMASLPIALLAGVGIGAFEQLVLWNSNSSWGVELGLFAIILIGLLVQRRGREAAADQSWLTLPHERPLPARFAAVWSIRNLNLLVAGGALLLALLLPAVITNARASVFVAIFSFATIGLSITVVTGTAGQISLGQFAIAGVGGLAAYWSFVRLDMPWGFSFVAAAIGGALASLVVGLPALRLRGLFLAVTSLGFAVAAPGAIFGRSWALGTGVLTGLPLIGTREVVTVRAYYYIALAVLVVCAVLVANLKRGGIGRILGAIRDDEDVARSFGINATGRKLQAFMVSGLIAGLGGAVLAQSYTRIGVETFPADKSVALLAMVVLGGISRVSGAIIGAAYLIGLPLFVNLDTIELMVTGVGVLILVLYVPGGLGQILDVGRRALIARLGRNAPAVDEPPAPKANWGAGKSAASSPDGSLLKAENLTVSYDQVVALAGLSFEVKSGETLGVIGPNGSGKTTLFKVLSGFLKPDAGSVWFEGANFTSLSPEARARRGLVRSFQDSMLFPTITVVDSIRLALERKQHTHLIASTLRLPAGNDGERAKLTEALELVSLMGLWSFKDKLVGELSTGTRRIAELSCLLALSPKLLLLDEPSSGIAQSETEALGELLQEIKAQLGTTLCIIEHDMPLIMGISDRIVAMASGRPIADGTPNQIQKSPAVVESYLG